MLDFNVLKKKARETDKTKLSSCKVAVLGNYATQFLTQALQYAGKCRGYNFEIYQADYDQIEMEVFNPDSGLYAFQPDFIFISYSSLKLQQKFYAMNEADKAAFTGNYSQLFRSLAQSIAAHSRARIIFNNLELLQDSVFEDLYAKVPVSYTSCLYELNHTLLQLTRDTEQVHLFDLNGLVQYYGARQVRDWSLYVNADLHFSLDFHAEFADGLARFITAFLGRFKKCIILDLDNTVWGGVIGDDGLQGIQVGSLGIGKAFTELQRWVKQLKDRGIIVAVCSKNTESVAKEPFEVHEEMVLRLEDIAVFVANWENKADNVRVIQQILNIGFDSMVFVDDNPAERAIIRQNLPDVTVPELPEDPALYLDYLKSLHLFETASYSAADNTRTKQYQEEAARQQLQFAITNVDDYLQSLEMTMEITPFQPQDIPRIAQLTQRSNQFNLRTVRYADSDIQQISNDNNYISLSVKLRDKFGDYGLIAVLILKKDTEQNALFFDTWLMSCRVLKRGVENAVLNYCAQLGKAHNFSKLVGEYIPTAKNALVKDHYASLQFEQIGDRWHLPLDTFNNRSHHITINN